MALFIVYYDLPCGLFTDDSIQSSEVKAEERVKALTAQGKNAWYEEILP